MCALRALDRTKKRNRRGQSLYVILRLPLPKQQRTTAATTAVGTTHFVACAENMPLDDDEIC